MRKKKHTASADGTDNAALYQKQVEFCIGNLKELLEKLLPLQRVATEKCALNKEKCKVAGILEIGLTELSALHEQFKAFLKAIVELNAGRDFDLFKTNSLSMENLGQALEALDLKSYDKTVSFNAERIDKIRGVRTALTEVVKHAQGFLEKNQLSKINEHLESPDTIKENLTTNNPSLSHFSHDSIETIVGVIGILNLSKKFNRDLGTLLVVQGLNPYTYEDERETEKVKASGPVAIEIGNTTKDDENESPKNDEAESKPIGGLGLKLKLF